MNVARSITILPLLVGTVSGIAMLQQVPDLDTSSAVSVLGWALAVAVIGIGGLFTLVWRFLSKDMLDTLKTLLREIRALRRELQQLREAFIKSGMVVPDLPGEDEA